jgi:NitT/TauT family transport system permease protein
MMIMWFGTGILAKVIMAGIAAFCVSVSQAFAGAKEAASQYGRLLKALQVQPRHAVRYFLAPAAVSWVVQGARINISLAIVGAFAGEFISSEIGLGHYVLKAAGLYHTAKVLAGVLAFVAIALFLDRLVAAASRRMFPWTSPIRIGAEA